MALVLDVVIDARDERALELGVFERGGRQWPQHRALERLEPRAPAALELLERPVVQVLQELADRSVELSQAIEAPMTQPREDPALYQLYPGLDLGLVPRFAWSRGQHGAAVVSASAW